MVQVWGEVVKETLGHSNITILQLNYEFHPCCRTKQCTGGWGPKWASAKVFLAHTGNLPHQHHLQQKHRGLVPGFPNPLPLSEEEREERDVPSAEEPRFRCFYFSCLCFISFDCPVFEWWCSINNCAEPTMTERGRKRENNELGSWNEFLIFIESRVSGRGFCSLSNPNPFFRCLTGSYCVQAEIEDVPSFYALGARFDCETCQNVIWGRQKDFSDSEQGLISEDWSRKIFFIRC